MKFRKEFACDLWTKDYCGGSGSCIRVWSDWLFGNPSACGVGASGLRNDGVVVWLRDLNL